MRYVSLADNDKRKATEGIMKYNSGANQSLEANVVDDFI